MNLPLIIVRAWRKFRTHPFASVILVLMLIAVVMALFAAYAYIHMSVILRKLDAHGVQFDFNSVLNATLFPNRHSGLPVELRPHRGQHPAYTRAMRDIMQELADDLSQNPSQQQIDAVKQKLVDLMDAAKIRLIDGDNPLPLHARDYAPARGDVNALEKAWRNYLLDFI